MSNPKRSRLRFNFGFLLEANNGTSRTIELDYPEIQVEDVMLSPLKGGVSGNKKLERDLYYWFADIEYRCRVFPMFGRYPTAN